MQSVTVEPIKSIHFRCYSFGHSLLPPKRSVQNVTVHNHRDQHASIQRRTSWRCSGAINEAIDASHELEMITQDQDFRFECH